MVHKEEKRRLAVAVIAMQRVVVEKARIGGRRCCVSFKSGWLELVGTSLDSAT